MLRLRKYFSGLSTNTWLLAAASLFSDISTEMLYPVLPVFLTQTLGAKPSVLGIVEGVATGMQYIVQGASGWLSDKLRRRKPIAIAGYILSAISKPLIGMSQNWTGVLAARSTDRLGAGTRSAPRDALVASSADPANRGRAFGLEGFGDNLGAFLGPILAIALLGWFHVQLRTIFLLAIIPGLLATAMVLMVREPPAAANTPAKSKLDLNLHQFPTSYWKYLIATGLFSLGNSSNSFLILRTSELGISLERAIFIYALFNLVAALASYPAGYLSDLLGRRGVLLLAFVIFAIVYFGFGIASNIRLIAPLFVLYGVYQGIFRAVGKALAIDFLPPHLHASGIGWYAAIIGVGELLASIVAGQLWTSINPAATFFYGAAFATIGSITLVILVPASQNKQA